MITNEIHNYTTLLQQVKQRVALAQLRAIYAANEELLRMYWDLTKPNIILQPAVAKLQKHSESGSKLHKDTITQRAVAQLPEYALRNIAKPIGISDFEQGQALPNDVRSSLPSIEEIEAELEMIE